MLSTKYFSGKLLMCLVCCCFAAVASAQSLKVTPSVESRMGAYIGDTILYVQENTSIHFSLTFDAAGSTVSKVDGCSYSFGGDKGDIKTAVDGGKVTIDNLDLNSGSVSDKKLFLVSLKYSAEGAADTTLTDTLVIDVYKTPSCNMNGLADKVELGSPSGWSVTSAGGFMWKYKWTCDKAKGDEGFDKNSYKPDYANSGTDPVTLNVTFSAACYAPDGTTQLGETFSRNDLKTQVYGELKCDMSSFVDKTVYCIANGLSWTLNPSGGTANWKVTWTYNDSTASERTFKMPYVKNETDIDKRYTIRFRAVNFNPEGKEWGIEFDKTITVTVTRRPYITFSVSGSAVKESEPVEGIEGHEFTIKATANNTPLGSSCTYTWEFNGEKIGPTDNAEQTFKFPEANADGYELKLMVTNTLVSVKDVTPVTVIPYPVPGLSADIDSVDVYQGSKQVLRVKTKGGRSDNTGWFFYYYEYKSEKDSTLLGYSKDSNTYLDVDADHITSGVHKYKVWATLNLGTEKETFCVEFPNITIWPLFDISGAAISLTDSINCNPDKPARYIREGNKFVLNVSGYKGGYGDGNKENYSEEWTYNGMLWNRDAEPYLTATMSSAKSVNQSDSAHVAAYVLLRNIGPSGKVWDSRKVPETTLTVCKRPQIPSSMVVKGNGTSGTMIVTMPCSDSELESGRYYLLFGYDNADGTSVPMDSAQSQMVEGNKRWVSYKSSLFNNSSNKFWVCSVWDYGHIQITSGKCYAKNQAADNGWDYSGKILLRGTYTRGVIDLDASGIDGVACDDAVSSAVYSLDGTRSSGLRRGLNIVRMSDGTVRKVLVK